MTKPVIVDTIHQALGTALQWLRAYLWFVLPGFIFLVFATTYAIIYLPINKIEFVFSEGQTCIDQATLLPSKHTMSQSEPGMSIVYQDIHSIADRPLWSSQACLVLDQIPQPRQYHLQQSLFGLGLISQTYHIDVASPPSVNLDPLNQPVSVRKPLLLALNQSDVVHQYQLEVEEQQAPCQVNQDVLSCGLDELQLKQGHQYQLELSRHYRQQETLLTETKIETLTATTITHSTIEKDQIVYSQPLSLTLEADKKLVSAQAMLKLVEPEQQQDIKVQGKIEDTKIIIEWSEKLPRNKTFTLSLDELEATDGSTLEDPYQLTFKTSDGPQVVRISIPRAGVALNSQAVITFDQPIKSGLDLSQIAQLNGHSANARLQQKQLIIPLQGIPKCTDFNISLKGQLISDQEVESQVEWNYNSRTICHTTEVIGHSVKGRAIVAYKFGSGSTTILYTGAIHGNEVGTKYLMDQWINELESKARQLPAGRTIVVVPLLNPDGYAIGTRNNANNVDLNRNFDTSDWLKDITDTYGQPIANGGGKEPMSEPETKAIANFTARLKPRTTMSFHNVGGVVIANQASHSTSLASTYSQLSGYRHATGQSSITFNYAISGTYDDWIAEKHGLASILVEMSTRASSEYARNIEGLWRIARY